MMYDLFDDYLKKDRRVSTAYYNIGECNDRPLDNQFPLSPNRCRGPEIILIGSKPRVGRFIRIDPDTFHIPSNEIRTFARICGLIGEEELPCKTPLQRDQP